MTPQLAIPLSRVANQPRGVRDMQDVLMRQHSGAPRGHESWHLPGWWYRVDPVMRHLGPRGWTAVYVEGVMLTNVMATEVDGLLQVESTRQSHCLPRPVVDTVVLPSRPVVHHSTVPIGKMVEEGMSDRNGECLGRRFPGWAIPHMPGTSIQEKRVRPPRLVQRSHSNSKCTLPHHLGKGGGGTLLGTLPEPALGPSLVI